MYIVQCLPPQALNLVVLPHQRLSTLPGPTCVPTIRYLLLTTQVLIVCTFLAPSSISCWQPTHLAGQDRLVSTRARAWATCTSSSSLCSPSRSLFNSTASLACYGTLASVVNGWNVLPHPRHSVVDESERGPISFCSTSSVRECQQLYSTGPERKIWIKGQDYLPLFIASTRENPGALPAYHTAGFRTRRARPEKHQPAASNLTAAQVTVEWTHGQSMISSARNRSSLRLEQAVEIPTSPGHFARLVVFGGLSHLDPFHFPSPASNDLRCDDEAGLVV